jgi:hypothetical protein
MPEMPLDPFSMIEGADALREMYLAYVRVGFTEEQAMQLVCAAVSSMMMVFAQKGIPDA